MDEGQFFSGYQNYQLPQKPFKVHSITMELVVRYVFSCWPEIFIFQDVVVTELEMKISPFVPQDTLGDMAPRNSRFILGEVIASETEIKILHKDSFLLNNTMRETL